MLRRNQLADLNRVSLDLAVEMNRRVTPSDVLEKRTAPRYSISELNDMDFESLRERFEKLPPIDDRPGIMRVLDVIDLPRNLVANALTGIFAPEVRREAAERGDRGAFGLPRVMGSDMLRAMGIDNRVVTAIAGFGIDLLTDPLAYVGAPIGGLAVRAGKAGSASFGRTGQKALMGGLKKVGKEGIDAVEDETVKRLFQTTAERYGISTVNNPDLAKQLSERLIGQRGGGLRRTADIVLGTSGRDGDLATMLNSVTTGRATREAAQIEAVKDFASKYTLNRGIQLGGQRAGSALAHLPFTDVTVYTPAWTKSGKQAVLQRAFALARDGQVVPATAFTELQQLTDDVGREFGDMVNLLEEREFIRNAESSGNAIEVAQDHLVASPIASTRLGRDMTQDVRAATRAGRQKIATERTVRESVGEMDDLYPDLASVEQAMRRGDPVPTQIVNQYLDDLSDEALSTYVQREAVDYRRTNKIEDIDGTAQADTGQVGLTAVAMLAKEDGMLKGRRLEGLDPSTVRVGDEFEIGDATARVVDDVGDAVEIEVTYPNRMRESAALPGADEGAEAATEVSRAGFTNRYVIPKTADNYIPANSDTLGRKVIRTPEDAMTINSRRIAERQQRIEDLRTNMQARLAQIAESGAFESAKSIGDVLAMVQIVNNLRKQMEHLANSAAWSNAAVDWARAGEQIAYARRIREGSRRAAAVEAFRMADGSIDPEFAGKSIEDMLTAVDNMAPDDMRLDAYLRLRTTHEQAQQESIRRWLDLANDDLDKASEVADAYSNVIASAKELSDLGLTTVRQTLSSDARELRDVAARLLGLDGDTAGRSLADAITAPFSAATKRLHPFGGDLSAKVAALGAWSNRTFGVGFAGLENGMVNAVRARAQSVARTVARGEGQSMKRQVYNGGPAITKGLKDIAKSHNIDVDDIDRLDTLVTAILASRGGDGGAFFIRNPNGELKESVKIIQDAANSGLLRGRPDLLPELSRLADEIDAEFIRLGEGSVELGLLKTMHKNYIPTQMSEQAATRARTFRSAVDGGAGGRERMSAELLENFQKSKGTWEIRFVNQAGEQRSFLLNEARVYRAAGDEFFNVNGVDDAAKAHVSKVNETVREFEEMFGSIDDEVVVGMHGRPLDPFELNRLAEDGVFADMIGELTDNMWQTRSSDLLASAVQQHSIAEAKQTFKDYVSQFGIPVSNIAPTVRDQETGQLIVGANGRIQSGTAGGEFRTADGTLAYVVSDRQVRIGDRTYRFVDTEKMENLAIDPYEGMFREGSVRYLYPEMVAETIERFATQLQPENITGPLKLADDVTILWRVSTLAHPSWTISNILGSSFQAAMDFRDRLPQFAVRWKEALSIWLARNNPGRLAQIEISVGGQRMSAMDAMGHMQVNEVVNGGYSREAADHVLRNGFDATAMREPIQGGVGGMVRRGVRRYKENYVQAIEEMALRRSAGNQSANAVARSWDSLKATRAAMKSGPVSSAVKAWFTVNGGVDDVFRMAGFLQYLDEGNDIATAAAKTRKTFFNFGDMTRTESQTFRALMPFYAWLRGSTPNMLMRLKEDPLYFSIIPKATEAVEELFAGEEQVPRHRRPRWINEQLGVQLGSNPETRQVLLAGTLLPQEQALRLASGVAGIAGKILPGDQGFGGREMMDMFDFFMSQLGPVVKIPFEIGSGRETFSQRRIGPTSYEGDISLNEYLLGQVRWLRETGVGSVREGALQRSFDQGIGTGVGRLLIGGRLQPGLQEDRRMYGILRDMSEKEEQIRRAFNLAQREGKEDAMLEARDRLMSLYRDSIRAGVDPKEIPKWAREDLMELGVDFGGPEMVE